MAESPKLLTVEEFAKSANIGRTLAFEKVASGEVESVKIGRLRRIPADALDRFVARLLDEQTRQAA